MIHITISIPGEEPQEIDCENYFLIAEIDEENAILSIASETSAGLIAEGLCQLDKTAPGMLEDIASCIGERLDEIEAQP